MSATRMKLVYLGIFGNNVVSENLAEPSGNHVDTFKKKFNLLFVFNKKY